MTQDIQKGIAATFAEIFQKIDIPSELKSASLDKIRQAAIASGWSEEQAEAFLKLTPQEMFDKIYSPPQQELAENPLAYTKQEAREHFLTRVHAISQSWANTPGWGDVRGRCEGTAFSILSLLDGSNPGFPAVDMALSPHEDDKEYRLGQGERYYEPGMVINDDVHLHTILNRKNRQPDPVVDIKMVEEHHKVKRDFDHLAMSMSHTGKVQLLPLRLATCYMQASFANALLREAFWTEFGAKLGKALATDSVGEIGDVRVLLYTVAGNDGSPQLQLTAVRLEADELKGPNAYGFRVVLELPGALKGYMEMLDKGHLVKLFQVHAKMKVTEALDHVIITEMATDKD